MNSRKPEEILKSARESRGLTQQELADNLGIGLRNYQHFESGRFPKFKTDVVKALDRFLEISIYDIIYGTQNVSHELYMEEPKPSDYLTKRRQQKTTSQPYMVPLVPVKARAGYVSSYDQTDFLNTLERYAMPPGVNPAGAIWRYFEVDGDSMEPTFQKDDVVLASMVPLEDWNQIRNFYIYVIVTDSQVLIKRLFRKSDTKWVMISDNEAVYDQELLTVSAIKELWVFRRRINSKAPPPKKFEIKI